MYNFLSNYNMKSRIITFPDPIRALRNYNMKSWIITFPDHIRASAMIDRNGGTKVIQRPNIVGTKPVVPIRNRSHCFFYFSFSFCKKVTCFY